MYFCMIYAESLNFYYDYVITSGSYNGQYKIMNYCNLVAYDVAYGMYLFILSRNYYV